MNLTTLADGLKDYELLDSGEGMKLEIIAGVHVQRPSPQAIWKKRLSPDEWMKATSVCSRTKDGGGQWQHHKPLPKEMWCKFEAQSGSVKSRLKLTTFGHCGIFFEQVPVWLWLEKQVIELKTKLGRAPKVANLFGYTGAASLVMAKAGAEVWHVDSSKGALEWGQENAKASQVENIRWMQEDAQKFLINQYNKGLRLDGMLADPPSWGHGAKKEVWEFEKHMASFLDKSHAILNKKNAFMFLSSHTHGVQQEALKNVLAQDGRWRDLSCGDLGVAHKNDARILPAGLFAAGIC
jgi:23S rRNA (cytosine1962-C5)-methyltransferase